MTKRDSGFLLIGAGVGLMLTFVVVLRSMIWMHQMFLVHMSSEAYVWMSLPWLCLIAGLALVRGQRRRA